MTAFIAENNEADQRIDAILATRFPERSRAYWQEHITSGAVQINQAHVTPHHRVKSGDSITIAMSARHSAITASALPLEIVYEDDQVMVINKPAQLITHPAHANTKDSVAGRLIAYNAKNKHAVYDAENPISQMRPGIVHRLDKDTSGVMIVAKTKEAMSFLAKQIQAHQAKKTYLALLYGHLEQSPLTIHTWLNRHTGDRRKMAVSAPEQGRESETIFQINKLITDAKGDRVTLVEASPITGRTHQIRVHASHIGHPVLGDATYGSHESQQLSLRLGLKRQFLHAHQLTIRLPSTRQPHTFTAPLPPDLSKVLNQFK